VLLQQENNTGGGGNSAAIFYLWWFGGWSDGIFCMEPKKSEGSLVKGLQILS
jgi:hypothetical protein